MTKTVNLLENGEKSWGELLTYNFSSRNKTKQTNKQTNKQSNLNRFMWEKSV